ncbi:hypothetical protein AAHH67_14655 [Niallia circulans]
MFDYWIPIPLSTSMMTIIGWGILIGAVCYVYRKQTEKPVIWKMAIILYIGLFCFNFSFMVSETPVKIAILPLGVWILILVLESGKNVGRCIDHLLGLDSLEIIFFLLQPCLVLWYRVCCIQPIK